MQATQYAEAIYRASRDKDTASLERIAVRVRELLSARGHLRLLPGIIRELARLERKRSASRTVEVQVTHEDAMVRYEAEIARDSAELGASDLPRVVVYDDTIVGGYEIRAHGTRIDRTHKRALVSLFTTLITH